MADTISRRGKSKKFTNRFVQTAAPGFYFDAGCPTLCLKVKPTGSRSWVQKISIQGKQTMLGLGGYPLTTLAEARDKATDHRRTVRDGGDPRVDKRASLAPTFEAAVEMVVAIKKEAWRGDKSEAQWRASLREYAFPKLGARNVDRITTADVMGVLLPIWNTKQVTAKRVRQRISAVMKWSRAAGYRSDNPAGEVLGSALPKQTASKAHHRALPFQEVGAALVNLRGDNRTHWATKAVFEFMVLTAARSGEARGAKWSEFDLDDGIWTIPADRMKAGQEHRVPLSRAALAILENAAHYRDTTGLVFPGARSRLMVANTLSKFLHENGIRAVPHGFRSSFRDWAAELSDAPREVAELALAHIEGSATERAYRRTDLFERRRELMQAWADYLTATSD